MEEEGLIMDNIREKLVELLCGAQDYGEKTKHLNGSYAFVERHDNRTIADYLLANGVTIISPPPKGE